MQDLNTKWQIRLFLRLPSQQEKHITYQNDFTLHAKNMEQIAVNGLDNTPEKIRPMINTAMKIERQKYLKAGLYERNEERQGPA